MRKKKHYQNKNPQIELKDTKLMRTITVKLFLVQLTLVIPLDETHLGEARELILLRVFNQCINKKSVGVILLLSIRKNKSS